MNSARKPWAERKAKGLHLEVRAWGHEAGGAADATEGSRQNRRAMGGMAQAAAWEGRAGKRRDVCVYR